MDGDDLSGKFGLQTARRTKEACSFTAHEGDTEAGRKRTECRIETIAHHLVY